MPAPGHPIGETKASWKANADYWRHRCLEASAELAGIHKRINTASGHIASAQNCIAVSKDYIKELERDRDFWQREATEMRDKLEGRQAHSNQAAGSLELTYNNIRVVPHALAPGDVLEIHNANGEQVMSIVNVGRK